LISGEHSIYHQHTHTLKSTDDDKKTWGTSYLRDGLSLVRLFAEQVGHLQNPKGSIQPLNLAITSQDNTHLAMDTFRE
jgi:hypothetical protein